MVAKKTKIKTTKAKKPRSKYGAIKVTHDNITFDSTMEGSYYLHLKEEKANGINEAVKAIKQYYKEYGV